jgi:hypothetical protein
MLNVAIAVDSVTDYGAQAVRVIAAACDEVIGDRRCPVASDLEAGSVAAWYAVVHPDDRGLSSVRIDFRDRTADGVLIEVRSLAFSAGDSQASRLASVGSVIAALVAAREGALTRPHEGATVLPAPRSPVLVAPEASRPDWSVELEGLAATSLDNGPDRLGGAASAHLGFLGRPFGLVSTGYSAHAGNPGFSWWTLSAGVGTRIGPRPSTLNVELSSELVFEHTQVAAERGVDRESAGQDGWGGRFGLAAVWAIWRHCSIVLGMNVTFVLPRVDVVVGAQNAASVPPATLEWVLGIRLLP